MRSTFASGMAVAAVSGLAPVATSVDDCDGVRLGSVREASDAANVGTATTIVPTSQPIHAEEFISGRVLASPVGRIECGLRRSHGGANSANRRQRASGQVTNVVQGAIERHLHIAPALGANIAELHVEFRKDRNDSRCVEIANVY